MSRIRNLTVAGVTAISMTLAPIPASAGPDGEDIAKTLAGLAILGIIATAVDNRNDRRDRAARTEPVWRDIDRPHDRRVIEGDLRRPGDFSPRVDEGYKRFHLPDRCLHIVDTARGERHVYGQRCLNRNFKFAAKLPERCERFVRTERGLRTVYGSRCLARDGWRVARR